MDFTAGICDVDRHGCNTPPGPFVRPHSRVSVRWRGDEALGFLEAGGASQMNEGMEEFKSFAKWAGTLFGGGTLLAIYQKIMESRAKKRDAIVQEKKNHDDAIVAGATATIQGRQSDMQAGQAFRDELREQMGLNEKRMEAKQEKLEAKLDEVYGKYNEAVRQNYLMQSQVNKSEAEMVMLRIEVNQLRRICKAAGIDPGPLSAEEWRTRNTAEKVIKKSDHEIAVNQDPTTPTIPTEPTLIPLPTSEV